MSRRMNGSMIALTGLLVWVFSAGMPVASADAALDQCRAQNKQLYGEATKLYQGALTASGNTPSGKSLGQIGQRLRQISQSLENFNIQFDKAGKGAARAPTLNGCQGLTQQLISVRDDLMRMASSEASRKPWSDQKPGQDDPAIAQCRVQYTQLHDETMGLYRRALAANGITSYESHQLRQIDKRLSDLSKVFNSKDIKVVRPLTLHVCRSHIQQLVSVRDELMGMLSRRNPGQADAALDQCRVQYTQLHDETMGLYRRALAANGITSYESHQLRQIDKRLSDLSKVFNSKDIKVVRPLTLHVCRSHIQQLVSVRDELMGMVSRGASREKGKIK